MFQILDDVVDVLDADAQADRLGCDAGCRLFVFCQLTMGGRSRVRCQRLGIADVDKPLEDLQRVIELHASLKAALDAECQQRRGTPAGVFLRQLIIGRIFQTRIAHPLDAAVPLQMPRHGQRVVGMPLHAQRKRLHSLQNQEGVEGAERRARVAQRHRARPTDIRRGTQRFCIDDAVVARLWLGELIELVAMRSPVEDAAIDQDAGDGRAQPAQVLGGGMQDDVAAIFHRLAERRGRHGVVDDDWHAVRMRHIGDGCQVGDIASGIADRFAEDGARIGVDVLGQALGAVIFGKAHINAQLGQHVAEERPGAAIKLGHGDDIVARLSQIDDGIMDGSLPARQRQRRHAAFHGCDALLQHGIGRVHDARIDIARHRQIKEVCAVLRIVKFISDCLINRHRHGMGGRLALIASVNGECFLLHANLS